MNKLLGLIIGVIASFGLGSSPARAAGLPLVISATVDYTQYFDHQRSKLRQWSRGVARCLDVSDARQPE
jgi:hypothetical protein